MNIMLTNPQENNVKRTRALKKSVEERKAREQKEEEITSLKDNIGRLVNIRDRQSIGIDKSMSSF